MAIVGILQLEPAGDSNNSRKEIEAEWCRIDHEEGNECTQASEEPPAKDIPWIVDSSDDSCYCCSYSEEDSESDRPPFLVRIPESDEERGREECMSGGEGVIERMRNQRLDPSSNFLRGYSPLGNTKIDHSMKDERQNDDKKYLECPDSISGIFVHHSLEPEKEEKQCSPENDRFTKNLNNVSKFRSYERSSRDEGWCISVEEVL